MTPCQPLGETGTMRSMMDGQQRLQMRSILVLGAVVSVAAAQVSCAPNSGDALSGAKKAMFKTRAEAEAAAPEFGCQGAHKMGEMWMVCDTHDSTVEQQHGGGH